MLGELIIFIVAGLGAGIFTGLIGLSAVNIVAPLLVIFLGFDAYVAIGLALGTDVFASMSASFVYWKKKQLEWKPALVIVAFALVGIFLGSFFGSWIPSVYLSIIVGLGIGVIGYRLAREGFLKKKKTPKVRPLFAKHKKLFIFLFSMLIGLIAGFFGGGGGLMILILLMSVFKFKIHKAIGTSVLAMTFIAFFSSLFHYINIPFSLTGLLVAGIAAIFGGFYASHYANKLDEFSLKKTAGTIITILGIGMVLKSVLYF
ncbi:sulfite exporter TauE/SafE family protein [archaeon]|nr:sulfite exporter TauE/SafE family protein [archaeon]